MQGAFANRRGRPQSDDSNDIEVRRLKSALAASQEENEFLKKTAVFFAKHHAHVAASRVQQSHPAGPTRKPLPDAVSGRFATDNQINSPKHDRNIHSSHDHFSLRAHLPPHRPTAAPPRTDRPVFHFCLFQDSQVIAKILAHMRSRKGATAKAVGQARTNARHGRRP